MGDPPHLAKLAIVLMPAEIDSTNADRVGGELAAALTPGVWVVIADMTATTFCDPAAITMLVSAHLRAVANNAELRLVTRSGAALRALAIAMVDYSLPVYPTVAAALIPRPAPPALPPPTLHPDLRPQPRRLWTARQVYMSTAGPGTGPPTAMGGDMRTLIVSSLVTLDGIHDDPQSWIGDYFDQQAAEESLAVLLDSDAMLMGRNTYDYFAPRWSSPSGPYLERIYEMRKYVFSSTLTAADWNNTTIIPGDPVAAVRELKQQGDRHLVIYGYGQLAQTLLEHGLVDRLNFVINPVMVGGGTPLFRPGQRTSLRPVSVTERRNGAVTLSYANA